MLAFFSSLRKRYLQCKHCAKPPNDHSNMPTWCIKVFRLSLFLNTWLYASAVLLVQYLLTSCVCLSFHHKPVLLPKRLDESSWLNFYSSHRHFTWGLLVSRQYFSTDSLSSKLSLVKNHHKTTDKTITPWDQQCHYLNSKITTGQSALSKDVTKKCWSRRMYRLNTSHH